MADLPSNHTSGGLLPEPFIPHTSLNSPSQEGAAPSVKAFSSAGARREYGPFARWLLKGNVEEPEAPYEKEGAHHTHPWWKVMCLTGVDYFSTLGYQPGIAALAAGALSPIATLILVLLTLFGALPMYKRVAEESPHGDGSISMLERLLSFWKGKLFVLCLIGFVATGFVITITLSAADATAHLVENPYLHDYMEGREVPVTLVLITLLGLVFLKGFNEAIGIAVGIVALYISLNLVVIGRCFMELAQHPEYLPTWQAALFGKYPDVTTMIWSAFLLFPMLALGLSGFETGVVVMPLVKGDPTDTPEKPAGRIRNAKLLLTTAALIMSVLLMCSSFITTTLIPPKEFLPTAEMVKQFDEPRQGEAYGRALAYLAHKYMGGGFGTIYDASTIMILWFAGASAMAGLLNIVPRYLPRYGMAPDWARASRPLVLIVTAVCFLVTIAFRASVAEQGAAYATGVLALMTSATIAVTLSAYSKKQKAATFAFGIITLIFIYTTAINIIKDPKGLQVACIFIAGIVFVSFLSRIYRTTELRVEKVELDEVAQGFIEEASNLPGSSRGQIRIIANKRQAGDAAEYAWKEDRQREDSHIPASFPILFLEVNVVDASEFSGTLKVRGVDVQGYRVLRAEGTSVPNAIAAFLMYLRDTTGKRPHAYFDWSEGNPTVFLLRYILFGQGDTAPVTREVLRRAEPNPSLRPLIHVDG